MRDVRLSLPVRVEGNTVRGMKKRLMLVAVATLVVLTWVAAALGAWQWAVAALAALQGGALLLLLSGGPQMRILRAISRAQVDTDRRVDNIGVRLTSAQESMRLDLADVRERLEQAD